MSIFERSVTCSNCTHILTRTQGKKLQDMFLVKIANKGTSLHDLCFLFLELLHEPLFCNFLCCTAASGPYLVTNRKALTLHEQNIGHDKIFKWWSRGSHRAHSA